MKFVATRHRVTDSFSGRTWCGLVHMPAHVATIGVTDPARVSCANCRRTRQAQEERASKVAAAMKNVTPAAR